MAHAIAQLAGRHAGERHDEEALERYAIGHIAGHQRMRW